MIRRYIISFLVTLLIISGIFSVLPFITRSQVQAGTAVAETWKADFTLGAPDGRYYVVDADAKSDLERGIAFVGSGPARVVSATVQITPKHVTWSEDKTDHSAPGAGMIARVKWDTPADAPNAQRGSIHIVFPKLRGIDRYDPQFKNGGYQMTGGQWVFREITAYRNWASLQFGQLVLGLAASLPLTMFLVGGWSLIRLGMLDRARRALVDSSESQSLPRIFLPMPSAQWSGWNLMLLVFSFVGMVIAACAISDGFLSSGIWWFIMTVQLAGMLVGLIVILATRANLIAVQVDADTLSIAKGPGEPQWQTARWPDLRSAVTKSRTYKGNHTEWLIVEFPDGQTRIIRDPQARQAIVSFYARFHTTA